MDVWEGETFGLEDPRDVGLLARLLAGRFEQRPGGWAITHRVGHVRLPSGEDLRIRSRKSPAAAVLAWIAYADPTLRSLGILKPPPDNAGDGDIGALVAALFAAETLQSITRHGLVRRYDRRQVVSSAVRGRIDFTRLAHQGGNLARLPCVAWERLPDTPLNRLLAAALGCIRRQPAMAYAARDALVPLLAAFDGVRPGVDQRLLAGSSPFPRNEQGFEPACALARLLLKMSRLGDGTTHAGAAFLVDIAALFEKTVVAGFREIGVHALAKEPVPYDVIGPDGAVASRREMEMDVFLPGTPAGSIVIDAKYKVSVSSANLQQVVTYCVSKGARQAVLVLPGVDAGMRRSYRLRLASAPGTTGEDRIRVEEVVLDTTATSVAAWRSAAVAMAIAAAGMTDDAFPRVSGQGS